MRRARKIFKPAMKLRKLVALMIIFHGTMTQPAMTTHMMAAYVRILMHFGDSLVASFKAGIKRVFAETFTPPLRGAIQVVP